MSKDLDHDVMLAFSDYIQKRALLRGGQMKQTHEVKQTRRALARLLTQKREAQLNDN